MASNGSFTLPANANGVSVKKLVKLSLKENCLCGYISYGPACFDSTRILQGVEETFGKIRYMGLFRGAQVGFQMVWLGGRHHHKMVYTNYSYLETFSGIQSRVGGQNGNYVCGYS